MRKKLTAALATLIILVANINGVTVLAAPEDDSQSLATRLEEHDAMGLIFLADSYDVLEQPTAGEVVATLTGGATVHIHDSEIDEDGDIWLYVSFFQEDAERFGYVLRKNVATSDEVVLEWEKEQLGEAQVGSNVYYAGPGGYSDDVLMFPASYQDALQSIKNNHPQWIFVAQNTGLDWNDVIRNEMVPGRSLITSKSADYMKLSNYGQGWHNASQPAVEFYIDPRNYLEDNRIFAFEQLTYNASYHNQEAVQRLLDGSFMAGRFVNPSPTDDPEMTYARAFTEVGASVGVSPFHLASRVKQEQGQGTSPLISGSYPGYEGLYNYFNVSASGTSNDAVIRNGLNKARSSGWTSVYSSIYGGAVTISSGYILAGQDTIYLQKFDVDASAKGLYSHQYMQNIVAPMSESTIQRLGYTNANSIDNAFVFKIPVYKNMPAYACPYPTAGGTVSINPPAGYTGNTVWIDGKAQTATVNDGGLTIDVGSGSHRTAVMYKYDGNTPVGMYVWRIGADYTATPLDGLADILIYDGFSIRNEAPAGIRMKTSIATSTLNQLKTADVDGYKLKEFGGLLMSEDARTNDNMVLGSDKVYSAASYDVSGTELIYESNASRTSFTTVLGAVPQAQYSMQVAFRSYITLSKSDGDITIYGPVLTRSMNDLLGAVH